MIILGCLTIAEEHNYFAGYTQFVVLAHSQFLISFFIWCVCVRFIFRAFLFALSTSSCVGVDVGVGCTGSTTSAMFALLVLLLCIKQFQHAGHRVLGTGHSGWNHVFAEMHFHAPHISLASHVCTSCMLHAGSSPALPVHRHQSCPLVTGSQFQFHWHSRSQVMAYVSCAVQCTFI